MSTKTHTPSYEKTQRAIDLENADGRSELTRLCIREHVTCEPRENPAGKVPEGFDKGAKAWRVKLGFQGRTLTVDFYTGSRIALPTVADVISCLCSDVRSAIDAEAMNARRGGGAFEAWCDEYGLDSDSRRAEATWRTCVALAPRVRRFLGDAFTTFAEAEH